MTTSLAAVATKPRETEVREFALPEIGPVIIEGPPVPRPWKELADLHFSDRMIYFMDR